MKAEVKKLVVLEGSGVELLQLIIAMSPEERERYGDRIRRQILPNPDEVLSIVFTRVEWDDLSETARRLGI